MANKRAFVPAAFVFFLTLDTIACSWAGEVKLVSDQWDNVCRVEITWGANAPDGTPIEQHIDVPRNWSITKPDRLCYRRASTPDNSYSPPL